MSESGGDGPVVGPSTAESLPNPNQAGVDVVEFERLYRAHYDAARRWARALGAASEMAEDAVQDAFIIAFRRRESFETTRSFRAWLFGILRRVLSDTRRSARRARARELRVETGGRAPDPREVLALKRARETVDAFVAGLDEPQRLVFSLCELEELSAPEAAAVLDIPVKTVRSRLRIARKKFERTLERLRARREAEDGT